MQKWCCSTLDQDSDCGGRLGHYICGITSTWIMMPPVLLSLYAPESVFKQPIHVLSQLMLFWTTAFVSLRLYFSELCYGFPSRVVLVDRLCATSLATYLAYHSWSSSKTPGFSLQMACLGMGGLCFVAKQVSVVKLARPTTVMILHLAFRFLLALFAQISLLGVHASMRTCIVVILSIGFYYSLGIVVEILLVKHDSLRKLWERYLVGCCRHMVFVSAHAFTVVATS